MSTFFKKIGIIGIALVVIAAGLISCGKKKKLNYINADFKNYFDYKVGSYWVFYDSLNHFMDSLSVLKYYDAIPNVDQVDESIYINMQHYYLDSLPFAWQWGIYLSPPPGCVLDIQNSFSYDLAEKMPIRTGSFSDKGINALWTVALLSSFKIGSKTYGNVYEILYRYDSSSFSDTFYIDADHGFLAVLLNNKHFHKRLYLNSSKIVH